MTHYYNILAQAASEIDPTGQQIQEIHQILTEYPWAFKLIWVGVVFTGVAVFLVFRRQQKIAANQVALAKMLEQLLQK